ncbi:YihY/virulence factor BrkB family protein [Nocardioides sp. zg-1228]|uniref:YihY/virulence factor BrkB family protein n=1 Tax=Nocardioides sp. zg-1228 TaxID=2763008 RepID=UPI001642BADE|nr:YihY/virulence factor BrkB family protein [Nocardioides sp. zg-1228]MBC2933728.1 YihY/virulence factor BrkB family protein [Nocardioides sp. zg-1228]QSF58509.1 YihY/virulence factor BrkB family protein [Nocardioides sp. zg-1228]
MSVVDTVKQRVAAVRERRPFIDHLFRMIQHYGAVKGNALAGAVTFFGFLSFFPILALAFAVVGLVAGIYSDATEQVVKAIQSVLPMVVEGKAGPGEISIDAFQDGAGAAAGIGAIGVLYSGLGWVSGLRDALQIVFETPRRAQPSFVVGKLKDLVSLVLIGVVLLLSVAVSGVVTALSSHILDWLGLDLALRPVLTVLAIAVGLGANTLLFFAIFKILADHDTPDRSLWSGALLGAVGFEVLKQAATFLISSTQNQPAFAVFGIALVLLIWINYFSRVVMLAASWAHTSREARARREAEEVAELLPAGPRIDLAGASAGAAAHPSAEPFPSPKAAFAAGAGAMLGLVALVRRRH